MSLFTIALLSAKSKNAKSVRFDRKRGQLWDFFLTMGRLMLNNRERNSTGKL